MPIISVEYAEILSLFIIPLTIGTAGGLCFKERKGLDYFITVSAIAFSILFTVQYNVIREYKGFDLIEAARNNAVTLLEESDSELSKVFEQYNTPAAGREKIRADFKTSVMILKDNKWLQLARDVIPFVSFFYALSIAGFSFFLMRKYLMKKAGAATRALELFRINDYFIFGLIAGWSGVILLDKNIFPVISIVSLNVALMVSTLYTVQALGIIKYFFQKRGFPIYILPLLIITIFILGPSAVMFTVILLMGIGSLDLWSDFRKLSPKKE